MPRRDRSSHVSKTPSERSAYHRYIRRLESQPTVEESIELDPSFEPRQELTEPTSTKERAIPLGYRLSDHFQKNWVTWLFGILMFVAVYLVYDSKVNIAILHNDLSNQQSRLDRISNSVDGIVETDHAQDLIIQELKIRLEFLVNSITVPATPEAPAESP